MFQRFWPRLPAGYPVDVSSGLDRSLRLWFRFPFLPPLPPITDQGFVELTHLVVLHLVVLIALTPLVFLLSLTQSTRRLLLALLPAALLHSLLGFRTTPTTTRVKNIPEFSRKKIAFLRCFVCKVGVPDAETAVCGVCGKEALSTGSRALTKHIERSSEGRWGVNRGKVVDKNRRAEAVIEGILRDCVWMNFIRLPGTDVEVLELREQGGYGARWSADGEFFRGFLEPHVKDGWQTGWKH